MWRGLGLFGLGAAVALAYTLSQGLVEVPERFNPWAPLDVMADPDFLTAYKLSRSRSDPALCRTALARTGMVYDPLPDSQTGTGCGFSNAVRLRDAGLRIGTPLTLSCPMALSFFMWERHALQPAAERHLGRRVAGLIHLGSYACRNVNTGEGRTPGARSRHATADALDVAGFSLQDGRRIGVLQDWRADSVEPEALFLTEAHRGACRFFPGVLGPAYNAVHRDHFHLEAGGYRMCR